MPLLMLTADRPPELRDTKANQTIDQVGVFSGGLLRWFKDVPCAELGAPLAPLLADAGYAMARAQGCSSCPAGPVQLNCMFREPLSPTVEPWPDSPLRAARVAAWVRSGRPFTTYSRPLAGPTPAFDGLLSPLVSRSSSTTSKTIIHSSRSRGRRRGRSTFTPSTGTTPPCCDRCRCCARRGAGSSSRVRSGTRTNGWPSRR